MSNGIKDALTALADTFVMNLTLETEYPFKISGAAHHPLKWFGTDWICEPEVLESLVDVKRELLVVTLGIVGNLNAVVISDQEQHKLTLFLIDASKALGNSDRLLPSYWLRENLYRKIVGGVKATFEKQFYDGGWKLKEKGNAWMLAYLDTKKSNRVTTYQGTQQVG